MTLNTAARSAAPDWIDANLHGDPPVHGACTWCGAHLPPTLGCLNLCDMPTGLSRQFNAGLDRVIARGRHDERVMEALGGCTCPPPRLWGYAAARDGHDRGCPMNPTSTNRPAPL